MAVRDFLLKELKMAENMAKYNEAEEEEQDFDEEDFVRVPIEKVNENSEPIREFKTYKILKSLNFDNSKEPGEIEFTGKINHVNKTYDDIPLPSNYGHPTREQLREKYPKSPDFKHINERG